MRLLAFPLRRHALRRRPRSVFAGSALLLALSSAIAAPIQAQQPAAARTATGTLAGRVISTGDGSSVAAAQIAVDGTTAGGLTDINGRYLIAGVPAGVHSIVIEALGYATKHVTDVRIVADSTSTLFITLPPQAIALEAVTVTATAERGSVARALDDQRVAVGVVNSVSADQISKSPDGDAAQVVRRVSGVTLQDGKYVFVRGLGERYTTTSLNGARVPSPEPERKVVPFDLFPAGLLQEVSTSKTFTPDQPGDFSGAHVDIRTKSFLGERFRSVSVSLGYTTATGRNIPLAPLDGVELFGFVPSNRQIPAPVLSAGDFQNPIGPDEMNRIAGAFRDVWSPASASGSPPLSASVSLGGEIAPFGAGISYVASGTYSYSDEARLDEVRSTAFPDAQGKASVESQFTGTTGQSSVLWGGILNLSTLIGSRSEIELNNAYDRSADSEAREELGWTENLGRYPLTVDRLRYVARSVRSHQLRGEHQLRSADRLSWSASGSWVSREEPDRSEIVYISENDPATGQPLTPAWFGGSNEAAVRTFGHLSEHAYEGSAAYKLAFDPAGSNSLKIGGQYRTTRRVADNHAYSIAAPGTLSRDEREAEPEQIFDGRYTQPGYNILHVTPLGSGGSYTADDHVAAGFAMLDLAPLRWLQVVGGARLERSEVVVDAAPTTGETVRTNPTYTDVLPSLALNLRPDDSHNLRLSASQTLARPEYRELAPILYREVIGAENVFGNPALKRTLIQNADLRFEWYPATGEVLSFGVFAKHFTDPIERVYLASSGTAIVTFINAAGATNYGVEAEARKRLGFLGDALAPFSIFANATVMRSRIRIGSDVASKTNDRRPMVGQAPYVLNAGLTWTANSGTSASVLYNVVGKRIVNAAEAPLPDVYEHARNVLDVALSAPLLNGVTVKFDGKNLLDPPYERTQGDVIREHYRTGRAFSLGLAWQF